MAFPLTLPNEFSKIYCHEIPFNAKLPMDSPFAEKLSLREREFSLQ